MRIARETTIVVVLSLLAPFLYAPGAVAAPGDLDPSFGTGGKVTTNFFDDGDWIRDLALQPDGKLVAAGSAVDPDTYYDFALARYNPDGTLDDTFGTDGKVTTDFGQSNYDEAFSVALQDDGKIVVSGVAFVPGQHYNFALARYEADGILDDTFGTDGLVTTSFGDLTGADRTDVAWSVAIQEDGKIVAAGWTRTDGTLLDCCWNAWDEVALARYNTNGTLDTSFGTGGKVVTNFEFRPSRANDLVIDPDGKLVIAGTARTQDDGGLFGPFNHMDDFALARYLPDGTLDDDFGVDGLVTADIAGDHDQARKVLVQPDGTLVTAGVAGTGVNFDVTMFDFGLARFLPDGTLDAGFGDDGVVTTDIAENRDEVFGLALRPDGKLVAAGFAQLGSPSESASDFALAQYDADGSLDLGFGADGKVTTDFDEDFDAARALVLQPDGKLVAAGNMRAGAGFASDDFALARYNVNGVVDDTVPSSPLNVTTKVGSKRLAAFWDPPADDGGSPLTGYTATADPGGLFCVAAPPDTSCVIDGLTNHTVYTVAVTATNAVGTSLPSDPSDPATPRVTVADFTGNGATNISVFRVATRTWDIDGEPLVQHGNAGDIPVPGDYSGDGPANIAVYRPSNGRWLIQGAPNVTHGMSGDIPVPADYSGDGIVEPAVFRPSTGNWHILGQPPVKHGTSTDIPVPGDYNGDGAANLAFFRPSNGRWYIQGAPNVDLGMSGDIPVPADYDGDGIVDPAVFRPSTGNWHILGQPAVKHGGKSGDIPVPGDYSGDGTANLAFFRPADGRWYIQGAVNTNLGMSGDILLPMPPAVHQRFFAN